MEKEGATWDTNDIAYVAALKCLGFNEEDMVFDTDVNSVFWIYQKTEELMAMVKNIAAGESLVDPLEFNRYFTGTKDVMFNFMRTEGVRRSGRGN